MATKYIIKKQLSSLPCRFILGCIGHSRELSQEINSKFLCAIENKFGTIEDLLPAQDFSTPPESYFREMESQPLSTIMIILEQRGAYTDLHYLKEKAKRVEEQFHTPSNGRIFNINPGAVGTYGLCLASHKPTGGRQDVSIYAYGFHPHFFFGGTSYYERIMRLVNGRLELTGNALSEGKFSEYAEPKRVTKFEELVRTLRKNNVSVELMQNMGGG